MNAINCLQINKYIDKYKGKWIDKQVNEKIDQ